MAIITGEEQSKLWAAFLAPADDPLIERGYIHRRTFEIALIGSEGANHDVDEPDLLSDAVEDRAAVEAAPEDWIEIPKYNTPAVEAAPDVNAGLARFAQVFFDANELPIQISPR